MSFNLEKYLVENNLTVISRKREALKEEEGDEPKQADVASAEKQFRGLYKKKAEYDALQKQVKAILAKHSYRDPSGALKIKDVGAYKAEVGNMPDRLKALKADIDKAQSIDIDTEEQD